MPAAATGEMRGQRAATDGLRSRLAATPVDVAVVVGLLVVGAVLRLRGLPTDGLDHDDTWVAAGSKASLDELWGVATNHPGFTVFLMGWQRVVPSTEALVLPVVLLGVVGPVLLYGLLRRLGHAAATSALAATLLATCAVHVQYSARLKPYTAGVTVVLVGIGAVHVLSRRRWTWRTAALWVVGAVVLGSVDAFATIATAAAMLVLALHPHGDRAIRGAALGAQALIQGAVALKVRGSYDTEAVRVGWEREWDSYIEVSSDLPDVARQIGLHLARVGQAYVGGGRLVGLLVVVVAVAGLVWSATKGPHRLASRYLLGLLVVALVGGLTEQIPFGPSVQRQVFPGSRVSLWLVPSLAVGLVAAVDGATAALRRTAGPAHRALPTLAAVVAVAVALGRLGDSPLHRDMGTRTATEYVERHRDAETVVVVFPAHLYAIAAAQPVDVDIEVDGDLYFGFLPVPRDRVLFPGPLDVDGARALVGDARQVVLHSAAAGYADAAEADYAPALRQLGFARVADDTFHLNRVERWERPAASGG